LIETHRLTWLKWEELGNTFSWLTNWTSERWLRPLSYRRWDAGAGRLKMRVLTARKRIDFNATKNYYQCMQIAHLIEQLTLLEKAIKIMIGGKMSIVKLSERLRNMLTLINIDMNRIGNLMEKRTRMQYE
jgi:hypothetical protein